MASKKDYKVCGSSVKWEEKTYDENSTVPAEEAKQLLKDGFPAKRLLPMAKAEAQEAEATTPAPPEPVTEPVIESEEETEEEAAAEEPAEGVVAKVKKAFTPSGKKNKK